MMLAALRTNTKVILWIVVVGFVGFIFAGWGQGLQRADRGPERGVIGRVQGVKITYQDFASELRNRYAQYAEQSGVTELPDQTMASIREEAWQSIVAEILVDQEIERRGINVSDEAVFDLLWRSPPDVVFQSPAFQDEEGNFDIDLYHREIQMHPERWEGVAQLYRSMLRRQMIQNEVQSGAFVTENEVWDEYLLRNEKARISFVAVGPNDVERDQMTPTEDEARAFFASHREEFAVPATVSLTAVALPKEPTDLDEEDAITRLEDLAGAIREGEDFAELAKAYSDGPSAPEGGDLGWFGRGVMTPAFEEAAFALDVGQVSDPFKTEFGYHIVLVEDRRQTGGEPEVKARHILVEVRPSENTLLEIEDALAELGEKAGDDGLAAAAEEMGYESFTTPHFPDGRYIPGVGPMRPAVKMSFESKVGTLLGPFSTPDAFYLFEVNEKLPKRTPTYEQLASESREQGTEHPAALALTFERQKEQARRTAQDIADAVRGGATLEEAAASIGLSTRSTELFARGDYVPDIGQGTEVHGASFGLRTGRTSGVVEVEQPPRYFVLRVEERLAADQAAFEEARTQLRTELIRRDQLELFASWLEGLRNKAKIEDFRDLYF